MTILSYLIYSLCLRRASSSVGGVRYEVLKSKNAHRNFYFYTPDYIKQVIQRGEKKRKEEVICHLSKDSKDGVCFCVVMNEEPLQQNRV